MVGKKYWYVMSFRAQKSLDFQGPPLPMPLVMMLHPSKPIRTAPKKKQQVNKSYNTFLSFLQFNTFPSLQNRLHLTWLKCIKKVAKRKNL